MAKLIVSNVDKTYRNGVKALDDFSFTVEDKELVVIVGPSGCGKTTFLRLISGLDYVDRGTFDVDGLVINNIPPIERNLALVFQNYALYPQMNSFDNMAIALKQKHFYLQLFNKNGEPILSANSEKINALKEQIKNASKHEKKKLKEELKIAKHTKDSPTFGYQRISNEEIAKRINFVSDILEITPFLKQRVSTLSGGQKQRVAIAKAIVKEPKILLMDEPLSNLDTKLRNKARQLIRNVHEQCGMTTIVVSHDQEDAMSLADKIVVMNQGKVVQVGTPIEIYNHPLNLFVASLFGLPPMNLIHCNFENELKTTNNFPINISIKQKEMLKQEMTKKIVLGIRSEDVYLSDDGFEAKVEKCELLGNKLIGYFTLFDQSVTAIINEKLIPGQNVKISFNSDNLYFFNEDNGLFIGH